MSQKKKISFWEKIGIVHLIIRGFPIHFIIIFVCGSCICSPLLFLIRKLFPSKGRDISLKVWRAIVNLTAYLNTLLLTHFSILQKGRNDWSRDSRYSVVVCNHQAYIDIIFTWCLSPIYFHYIAKDGLKKNFLVAGGLKGLESILIDRSSKMKLARSVMTIKRQLNEGRNIFLFPEGTRNKTPDTLLPFKKGFYSLIANPNTQILPMVIYGVNQLVSLKYFYTSKYKLKVHYLPPIDKNHELHPYNTTTKLSADQKIEKLRGLMQSAYNDLKNSDV